MVQLYNPVNSYATPQIEWFRSQYIFDLAVNIVRQTNSTTCVYVQEYWQQGWDARLWILSIPNNTFMVTLISLVRAFLCLVHIIYNCHFTGGHHVS